MRSVVTEDDGSELALVPAAFSAVTANVYAVFCVRPVIVTEVLVVVAVTPPGSDVTVYSVMGLPPSEAGAIHKTTARTSPGIADTSVGVPGAVGVVTEFDESEDGLAPMEFVAVTVKVYAVPFVRPVTVTEVLVVVAVTLPGSDVTVYLVIGLPPSSNGAFQVTVDCPAPDVAVTSIGAVGSNEGICARP